MGSLLVCDKLQLRLATTDYRGQFDGNTTLSETLILTITDDAGVYAFDGSSWTQFGVDNGLASETVYDVIEITDRSVWMATSNGVTRFLRDD